MHGFAGGPPAPTAYRVFRVATANVARAAGQIRFARPTDQLDAAVVRFYRDGLGLRASAGFADHAGYTRRDARAPGTAATTSSSPATPDGSPGRRRAPTTCSSSTSATPSGATAVAAQLRALGGAPVAAENPYWDAVGALTFEDPDGWRVVLVPSAWG